MDTQERRITNRLLDCWNQLKGSKTLPLKQDIPELIGAYLEDLWNFCFVITMDEISNGVINYTYEHFGDTIQNDYTNSRVLEQGNPPLATPQASRLHNEFQKIAKTKRPAIFEGEFLNADGKLVYYRQILTPFATNDNGSEVTAVLGGMRYKVS